MRVALFTMALIVWPATVQAGYVETMDPNGPARDLKADYGLVNDDAKADQSAVLQKAINDISAAGGGRLIVPKGTYRLARVYLKSNVHLLIELEIEPDAKTGTFAEGSSIRNIHAVFGRHAQVKTHAMLNIPKEYHDDLDLRWWSKFLEEPSIGAVRDTSGDAYNVVVEDVTMEGFKYNTHKKILTAEDDAPGKWPLALKAWKAARGMTDKR